MGRRSKAERDAYQKGVDDGQKGRYKGQSWGEHIGEAIFGKTDERTSYERGVEKGKRK